MNTKAWWSLGEAAVLRPAGRLMGPLMALLIVGGCAADRGLPGAEPADVIFHGGPIVTVDPRRPEAQALAVRKGRILAVGDEADVMKRRGVNTTIVDLHGTTLMPGFVEPHVHVAAIAVFTKLVVNLADPSVPPSSSSTIARVQAQLAAALPRLPPGGWLIGFGVDPSRSVPPMAALDADTLDQVSTAVPIVVLGQSGHVAYVNRKALDLAGITAETPDPPGGTYLRDAKGALTGVVEGGPAIESFRPKIQAIRPERLLEAGRATLRDLAAAGVTTAVDVSTGRTLGFETETELLKTLSREPGVPVRIRSYLDYYALPPRLALRPGEGNDLLRFVGIDFEVDGPVQSGEAALTQPYGPAFAAAGRGRLAFTSAAQLRAAVQPWLQQGWQIAAHADGDLALDEVLAVYEALPQGRMRPRHSRLRIEHMTVTRNDQLDRVARLHAGVSLNPGQLYYWGRAFHEQMLGPQRARRAVSALSLLRRGVTISLHSDAPVTTASPLRAIQNAVTRQWQWPPQQVLAPEQRLTVDQAIRAVTLDAAHQLAMDDVIGSLQVGKWADLVVLEKNPRAVDPGGIGAIPVLATYLRGEQVHPAVAAGGK